ncbi:PASTA domain-containing protein [Streptomyces shenzhenensis]|uniref:PASTA domain-containing protein n=1 Tax=Streptomyces shenzhenensis TaxID=943815 RepID=UPI001F2BE33A|nr:PASTA domain-containing protein [Streptomyces shenzhenensis]
MNPYNTPAPSRPWWRTTQAALGALALVALLGAFSFALGFLAMIAALVAVWVLPPWRWFARLGATLGALLLLTVGAGLGGQLDDSKPSSTDAKARNDRGDASAEAVSASPAVSESATPADYTGRPLNEAERQASSAGYTAADHDAGDDGRTIILRSGWTVCFQKADSAAKTIDFAAVRKTEPCPDKDGGPLPWPKMPDVVGATYDTAVRDLKRAGVGLDRVTLDDVYLDVDTPTAAQAAADGDEWRVCFQSPDEGAEVTSTSSVSLDLGRWTDTDLVRRCPAAKDTTYKIPASDPDFNNSDDDSATGNDGSDRGGSSSSSRGSTGGSSSGADVGAVHSGSFCSPPGATGLSAAGRPMVCSPGSDGRNRWHHA